MIFYMTIYVVLCINTFLILNKSSRYMMTLDYTVSDFQMCQVQRIIYFVFCFFLIGLSCLRYGLGTDYFLYESGYNGTNAQWEIVDKRGIFGLLINLFNKLNLPYQALIAFFAIASLSILFYLIKRYSWNPMFSLAVLVGMSFYSFSLSGFRQFAAIILIMFAIHMNSCSQKIKHLYISTIVILLVAGSIHQTSLIASVIILLIFFWKPKTSTIFKLSIAGVCALGITRVFIKYINQLITIIVGLTGYYSNYLKYGNSSVRYYRLYSEGTSLFNIILLIPCLFLIYRIIKDYNEGIFRLSKFSYVTTKLYFIYQLFLCMNMSSEMIDRFAFYFSFSMIFSYPLFLKYIHFKWNKKNAALFSTFLCLANGYMFARYLSNNAYGIIPYVSILSK